MITPIMVPVASGHWGIGPSLVYFFGMIGTLIYVIYDAWINREPSHPSMEERRRREVERRKDEAFTRALKLAAAERRGLGL